MIDEELRLLQDGSDAEVVRILEDFNSKVGKVVGIEAPQVGHILWNPTEWSYSNETQGGIDPSVKILQ